jgi:hypothetical protein
LRQDRGDQRDADVGVLFAPQVRRRVGKDDLKRGPDHACHEVSAPRRSIGQPENDVHMQARFSVVTDRDIADRAKDLALLIDCDLLVSLLVEVEPADGRLLERADGRQRGRRDANFVGELRERREGLFSGVEHDDAGLGSRIVRYLLALHGVKPRCAGCDGLP